MKKSYEKKAKERKIASTIGYGIMWLSLGIFIEVIAYLQHYNTIIYHILAVPVVIAGVYTLYRGITRLGTR